MSKLEERGEETDFDGCVGAVEGRESPWRLDREGRRRGGSGFEFRFRLTVVLVGGSGA